MNTPLLATFQPLLTSLDDEAGFDASKSAWSALKKQAGALVKPLAGQFTFKHSYRPPAAALLQLSISAGGDLRALAEASLRAHPREAWEIVQEVPTKGLSWLQDVERGPTPRILRRAFKKPWTVHDARDLSVLETLKPATLSHVVFAPDGGFRAIDGRTVVSRGASESKWKKLHEFGEAASLVLSREVAAGLVKIVEGEGEAMLTRVELEVFSFETGAVSRLPLPDPEPVSVAVGRRTIVVNGSTGSLFVSEAGGPVSERRLPEPASVHELVQVGSTVWANTWRDGSSVAGPWRRFDDFSEGPFGHDFEFADAFGEAVWSRNGVRSLNGQLTTPIYFDHQCRGLVAIDDRNVVALRIDGKDKEFLFRATRIG